MESSDNENTQKDKNNENVHENRVQEATSSRAEASAPLKTSYNMGDLKAIDFNSADEIRQRMKAVLAGKNPRKFSDDFDVCATGKIKEDVIKLPDECNEISQVIQKTTKDKTDLSFRQIGGVSNRVQIDEGWVPKQNNLIRSGNRKAPVKRRKPGKLSKVGPSKKIRKATITAMYLGKLSNFVSFKRYDDYESESDIDSVVYY